MSSLHRMILYRLLAAWVVISLLIGVAVSWVGLRRIDRQLVSMATAELRMFAAANLDRLGHPETARAALDQLSAELSRDSFIAGEFQDNMRRKLAATVNPRYSELTMEVARLAVELPLDQDHHFRKFNSNGLGGLRVLVPFRAPDGTPAGYFEGAFLVDPELAGRLREDLVVTLLVALAAVTLTTLCLYPIILSLNRNVVRQSRDLLAGNIELMEVVGTAIAKRDSMTSMHHFRVATYAVRLAEEVGLDPARMGDLIAGAFLHDVGKIGISDNILLKPGSLDADEAEAMKRHVPLGVDILRKSNWLMRARDVVEYHHEKFDGSGYGKGLAGERIPLIARIFTVVDVFDALTSKRSYKDAVSFGDAITMIRDGAGSFFDPRLAEAFIRIAEPLYREIRAASDAEIEARLRALIDRYFVLSS